MTFLKLKLSLSQWRALDTSGVINQNLLATLKPYKLTILFLGIRIKVDESVP